MNDDASLKDAAARMAKTFGSAKHKHYVADFTHAIVNDKGKVVPAYVAVDGQVTVAEFERHLRGEIGILAVPVNEMGQTRWGKIDLDDYTINPVELAKKVALRKLPLIVELSKSGGVHLAYYSQKFESAGVLREKLSEWAAGLNYSGVEIFPKQDMLLPAEGDRPPDVGSGINVPYMGGDAAKNHAVNAAGEKVSLSDWLEWIENPPAEVRYTPGAADITGAAEYLGQFWVDGKRDRLNIALIGTLIRSDIEEDSIAALISAVKNLCADREYRKSVIAVRQDLDRGKRVPGWTTLVDPQNDFMKPEEATELMRLMGAKPPAPPKPQINFAIGPNPDEYLDVAPPPIEYTAGLLFPRQTVAVIASEGGSGKTAFIQHIELGVATGTDTLGLKVTKGLAVHLAMEDREGPLRRRKYWTVKKAVEKMMGEGCSEAEIDQFKADAKKNWWVVAAAGSGLRLLNVEHGVVVINDAAVKELIEKLPQPLELLVLDPMARLSGASENANEVGTAFIDACERISQALGCAVVILHHTGKGKEDDESAYASRGGSALPDAARSSVRLMVVKDKGDMDVSDEVIENGELLKIIHNKCNDGPKAKPFYLKREALALSLFTPRQTSVAERRNTILDALYRWYDRNGQKPFTRRSIDTVAVVAEIAKCSREEMRATVETAIGNDELIDAGKGPGGGKLLRFRDGFQPPEVSI